MYVSLWQKGQKDIMEKSIDFLELYESIFSVLPSGNIQKLMEICYEIIGVPIMTVDVTYHLFGIAPQEKKDDYPWDYLVENRSYNTEMAVLMYEEGFMQSVNERKAPYVVDWGSANEDFPKILGVIRVNDIVEGYVIMRCSKEQITPERMKAMEVLQNALSFFFKNNDTENSMHYTYQKVFIGELLNNRIHTREQLELWFKNIGNRFQAPYRIMTVSTDNTQEKNVLSYIRKTVHPFFPCHLALIQNNVLYILEYRLKKNAHFSEQFDMILRKFNAHCGASNYFYDLLETANYQIQAEDALMLGKQSISDRRVYEYKDYYLPAILVPRIEQMPPCNYISPVISKITDYDQKHSTDFLSTIYAYVRNLGNAGNTAEELHIHRNTLLYRINRIEEITDSPIKGYETFIHLMISFYMIDYNKRTDT